MTELTPGSDEWLAQIQESIVDPERAIVDPHHHLWGAPRVPYLLENLWRDTDSGHRVAQTVFVECGTNYYPSGPEQLRSVGETEFVAGVAAASRAGKPGQAEIAAIVARADLTMAEGIEDVLAAHEAAADGLFRGIRHAGARDPNPESLSIPGRAPEGLYQNADFRRGVKRLGELGYSYDTWHYHHQNRDFVTLARAVPDTPMVLDHFGTPLGVGPYADQREEIFIAWQQDMVELARCENVVAKLGGLAMPDNGFGWHADPCPPISDEFVRVQRRYYLHTIECFGPERCMFESNFPVDKRSLSYHVMWNGMKKIVADFTEAEKDAMFSGTARRIYRIEA